MATVDGFTKARSLAIENGTVVSGSVDGSGHLILTHKDGSTVDAGLVRAANYGVASDTTAGIIRIATDAETIAGTNDSTAVSPQDLEVWFGDSSNASTEAARGLTELATTAETITGTDDARAVTPLKLSNRLNDRFRIGTISATWSSGLAPVLLDDNVTTVNCYISPTDPDVQPGALVKVERVQGGLWVINTVYNGKPRYMKQIPLTLNSPWILYADTAADTFETFGDGNPSLGPQNTQANAGKAFVTMTSTGIVTLMGLLITASNPASGTIICTLPVGMRPAREQWLPIVCSSNAAGSVVVQPDGSVRYYGGSGISFFSLNGVRFRAAGYGTFTALTLIAPMVAFTGALTTGSASGAGSHTPGYTIDTDGVVIFEGCITSPSAIAANTDFAQTAAVGSQLTSHFVVAGTAGVGTRYGASSGAGGSGSYLNTQQAFAATGVMSIASMIVAVTPVGWSWNRPPMVNSWVDYDGTNYMTAQVGKTPDGLVLHRGLIKSGALSSIITYASKDYRSRFTEIIAACATSAFARFDVNPQVTANAADGRAGGSYVAGGTVTWASLEGIVYPAWRQY